MNVFRLRRALVPLFGVLAAMAFSAAQAETFGRSTIGATPSSGLRGDFKRGSKYTLTQPGVLQQLCAYVDGRGTSASFDGGQGLKIVMYRDSGGVPGLRVAEGYEEDVRQGDAPEWRCSVTQEVPLEPGAYWIVLHTSRSYAEDPYDGTPVIRYYADGTGNWFGNADAFADGPSLQFGAGGTGNGTLSAYAQFATAPELKTAGRTSIGATPSGALRTNFKRGSSFTLAEEGRLTSISGYFDGLGATSGWQPINLAVYRDNGGVPNELVAATNVSVNAGMSPQWLSSGWVNAVTLPAGKYWLVVHSGGQHPVARYYGDGTGNWYGNADTYADGASDPFGAGGTGNGTISAFVTYEPGPFTDTIVGAQTPGTPQRILKKDFAQGSEMGVVAPNAAVTGVNAYIDGLGGGSGSQRVKLVIMNPSWTDIYATEERVIPAGAPPQWVHFALPPFRNDHDPAPYPFWVFIASDGDDGVARIYGTPGTGYEVSVRYAPEPYTPPFFFDYPLTPNNVTYSFNANVQVRVE